ncbi:MAG: anthranilate phosphoribosyltransferase [Pseudomonadota bacterium]
MDTATDDAPRLAAAIRAIARGETLVPETVEAAIGELLAGKAAPEQVGAFLTGLAVRGETAAELIAGARAMRSSAHKADLNASADQPLLDTCGTGGLTWTSLNTSTASAIVLAACGVRVAKHGNRSVPPKTGSADVLEALGVDLDMDAARERLCIETAGVTFLYARSHHSAMRHVAPVRAKLGIRTLFNLLGPLSNPAGANRQVLGVFAPEWVDPMAEALLALGVERAWVVHGTDGIDEVSIAGETQVAEIQKGDTRPRRFTLTPEQAGLPRTPLKALEGSSPEANAAAITALFGGETSPFRDAVCLNVAAGLVVCDAAPDLETGVRQAAAAIDGGKARATLAALVDASHGRGG